MTKKIEKDKENSLLETLDVNKRIKINDEVFYAIAEKDKDRLSKALADGYQFEKVYRSKKINKAKVMQQLSGNNEEEISFDNVSRNLEDTYEVDPNKENIYSLINVITSGWDDGWDILFNHFLKDLDYSQETDFPVIYEVALQHANLKVLKDIKSLGLNIQMYNSKRLSSIHVLFDALNFSSDFESTSPVKVLETVKWLESEGVDIYENYPGVIIDTSDFRKTGHNLFTYALKEKNYDVLKHIIPESWLDIIRSPRWKVAIDTLFKDINSTLRTKHEIKEIKAIWTIFKDRFFDFILDEYKPVVNNFKDLNNIVKHLNEQEKEDFFKYLGQVDESSRSSWFELMKDINNLELYIILDEIKKKGHDTESLLLQQDKFEDTPLDTWVCYFEAIPLNKIPKESLLERQIGFYINHFSQEKRSEIHKDKGFSFNDFMISKISQWSKYNKSYNKFIEAIKK